MVIVGGKDSYKITKLLRENKNFKLDNIFILKIVPSETSRRTKKFDLNLRFVCFLDLRLFKFKIDIIIY